MPATDYFYDNASQDCLTKNNLPIGCLKTTEAPGGGTCRHDCEMRAQLGENLTTSCYRRFVLHNCSEDSSMLVVTFIFDPQSLACVQRNPSDGCYSAPRYFVDNLTCNRHCRYYKCPEPQPSTFCPRQIRVVNEFFNTMSLKCETMDNLCLAGLNRFETLSSCVEACMKRNA
ncbi:hypothetical protein ISCGN_020585 [Ixodes scapularis]